MLKTALFLGCWLFSLDAGSPLMGAGLDSELQQRVAAIASAHQGHMTLFAEDLATGKTVAIEPDTPVPTASVIKLAILFEALEQVRSGKAHFEERLTLTKADQVPGAGVLLFFDPPQQLTLKDALTLMVVMSDNAATNLVIDHLGLPDINRRIEWMGLHNTHLFNKVFSKSSPALPPKLEAEHKKFGLGETTAREMASVIERIYRCELGTAREATPDDLQLCTIATTMLGNQFYRDCIPRFLDGWNAPETGSGTAVGNKTGSLDEVRNDVAIVAAKRGPIVISAFTFDNKDQSWRADNQAQIAIANAAKAIVESWSPEGLAPNEYKPHPADSNRP